MRIIGMLSGTSHDAADAVVADLWWTAPGEVALHSRGMVSVPFPERLRADLADRLPPAHTNLAEMCQLDTELGQFFGSVAARARDELGGGGAQWVVSHGQTVYHWVRDGQALGTLQLGAAAWIAEAAGLPVVSDLRTADIARGGQGAPLVALLDALLLPDETWGALNLGGIANLTVRRVAADGTADASGRPDPFEVAGPVGPGAGVTAYDLGPACALIDESARWASEGAQRMDVDGARAARGRVDRPLLERLLADPYYRLPPPKTTGKEHFHAAYLREQLAAGVRPAPDDLVATVTELTARLVADACHAHGLAELAVSGGGVRNPQLMARIGALADGVRVRDSEVLGVAPQEKEACLFALLGFLSVHGVPANVPSATGARGPAVLGSLTPGSAPLTLPAPVTEPLRRLRIERTPPGEQQLRL
ncbi:anhydro-N-acetylmuramic acid kinase [Streptomyces sp. XM4193]|uniref:anhydro-N-acetylmuramic acid kinase n=1 Tax=Streptomyces sp. XM4193 TaxID=2929782 RepID=UPI001FF9491B|nr:anhydro-N-acetylmuramic acid kinase [Streptomyces sp. XM4193]MCK1797337.1 anhydro-N-acetylmuramic acid kinase [Streptomyces sp. XM4193]